MGLLDDLTGNLSALLSTTGASSTTTPNLVTSVMSMLNDPQHGGLTGLVQSFTQSGLGDIISSWIGTGQNQTISPDQVTSALGSDRLRSLSQSTGLSISEIGSHLSSLLPTLIDKLTPDGRMPTGDLIEHAANLFKGRLS